MATNESSVGNHLAELYNSIAEHQKAIEDAKAVVADKEAALAKVKSTFADYLREAGVMELIAPAQRNSQTTLFGEAGSAAGTTGDKKERKPRTSSADKASEVERNRAIYTSQYPQGLDDKTGLPKKFKGRGGKNEEIAAMMKDDERDYEARSKGGEAPAAPAEGEQPAAPAKQSGKPKK